MPKASSSTPTQALPPSSSTPNILKRNQACHQCRRRKLKCNAQRPCTTCIRSHANALATSGASVPLQLECTYDEIPEPRASSHEPPKNRYERLEGRINELESLLRQKDMSLQAQQSPWQAAFFELMNGNAALGHNPLSPAHLISNSQLHMLPNTPSTTPHSFNTIEYRNSPDFVVEANIHPSALPCHASYSQVPGHDHFNHHSPVAPHRTSVSSLDTSISHSSSQDGQNNPFTVSTTSSIRNADLLRDLFWPSWPVKLPSPDLLQHLVDVFFTSLPHATRILHRPSFQASLSLPPTAPGFPETSILHAICAVSSLFSPAIPPPPLPNLNERPAEELFHEKWRRLENRDDSFGETHAKYAKEAQEDAAMFGEGLLPALQSVVILSWFYYYHARWVDVWLSTGEALRYCVPLGLNVCEPQIPLTRAWKTRPEVIPPSRTIAEEEIKRNIFWLAYAMDRFHSCITEFAMNLDDEDVTQVMPCLMRDFDDGTVVPAEQRQRLTTPRLLTMHPPELTDSFVLYIKATVLLSKVKIFNLRFRSRFLNGTAGQSPEIKEIDPRETAAFKTLDAACSSFRQTFPKEFRDPIPNGVVNSHLYVAHLAPHTATLLLHDPHTDFVDRDRSEKLKAAARGIIDLVYMICSTSYDITLLDPVVMTCWWTAARELVREMQLMQQTGQPAQVAILRSEVGVIRLALARLGARIPLGYRQARMLDDLLAQDVPDFALDSMPYNSQCPISGLEEVDAGCLEQLIYNGMR